MPTIHIHDAHAQKIQRQTLLTGLKLHVYIAYYIYCINYIVHLAPPMYQKGNVGVPFLRVIFIAIYLYISISSGNGQHYVRIYVSTKHCNNCSSRAYIPKLLAQHQ